MCDKQGVFPNIYHPDMNIHQPRQMLALTTSNGHTGGYWLNISLSYTEVGMGMKRTYQGFSNGTSWNYMNPWAKRKEKDVSLPTNLLPDTKMQGLHLWTEETSSHFLYFLKCSGGWLLDDLLISPYFSLPTSTQGLKNSRKQWDSLRSWRRADGGTVHSGKCFSKQSPSVRDAARKQSRNSNFEKEEQRWRTHTSYTTIHSETLEIKKIW